MLLAAVFLCFLLAERGIKHSCMHCTEYIKNGTFASTVVQFLVSLAEKQAVKVKKSSTFLTWPWAKKALSDALSAHCVYITGRCFPAEWKFD